MFEPEWLALLKVSPTPPPPPTTPPLSSFTTIRWSSRIFREFPNMVFKRTEATKRDKLCQTTIIILIYSRLFQ